MTTLAIPASPPSGTMQGYKPLTKLPADLQHCIFSFLPAHELSKLQGVCKDRQWQQITEHRIQAFLFQTSHFFKSHHVRDTTLSQQSQFWHRAYGHGLSLNGNDNTYWTNSISRMDRWGKYGAEGKARYSCSVLIRCAELFRKGDLENGFALFNQAPPVLVLFELSWPIPGYWPVNEQLGRIEIFSTLYSAQYQHSQAQAPAHCHNYGELVFLNRGGFSSTPLEKAEIVEALIGKIFRSWLSLTPIFTTQRCIANHASPLSLYSGKSRSQPAWDRAAGHLYEICGRPPHVPDDFGILALFDEAGFTATPAQKWAAIERATGLRKWRIINCSYDKETRYRLSHEEFLGIFSGPSQYGYA